MTYEAILSRFTNGTRKRTATGWVVCCPAHDDKSPSLSVTEAADKVLFHCHAGCAPESVCEAIGVTMADLYYEAKETRQEAPRPRRLVCKYDYTDESGVVLYRKLRFEPKTFGWERVHSDGRTENSLGDVRRVPYRAMELNRSAAGDLVWIVEGEKDVDNLMAAGAAFVTSSKDWQPDWAKSFLIGRRVVIIRDNDKAGEKIAATVTIALGKIPASVIAIGLPGAVEGGDVSDWMRGGGTLDALNRLIAQRSDSFVSSAERVQGEREARLAVAPRLLSFGIPYLDHALTGIRPSDVVLYSAGTGIGKTEAAATTALSAAAAGKRVHMFALEAEPFEIEMRIKYRLIATAYYHDDSRFQRVAIRYQDWAAGLLDRSLGRYEDQIQDQLDATTRNLKTYYRAGDFSGSDFVRIAAEVAEQTDLIVLDHLHYLDNDEANENAGYKRMTKQIRDSALTNGKPVLAVAHIRKSDRFAKRLIPTIEDVHGSSDISKIVTKAVMFARADDQPSLKKSLSNTYIQVVKNRTDGSTTRYIAMVGFDLRTNNYDGNYEMFVPVDGGTMTRALTGDELPDWAIGATRAPSKSFYDPATESP
jgi:RecA/RadA recombinase